MSKPKDTLPNQQNELETADKPKTYEAELKRLAAFHNLDADELETAVKEAPHKWPTLKGLRKKR